MAKVAKILKGRRGLVLGMSSRNSLGYYCATAFKAFGAEVAVTYRPTRRDTCAALAEEAGCAFHFGVDTNDEDTLAAAFGALQGTWGRLDFLIHTIAHVPEGVLAQPLVELARQDFQSVMDSNIYSLILASRYAVPLLEQSNSPRMVTLSSISDQLMTPNYHIVGISKAALIATTRYLAYELGSLGILCNAVSFSLLPTDGAMRAVGPETALATHAALSKRTQTRKALEVGHITNTIAFLASELCDNITGEVVLVDGGFSNTYFGTPRPTRSP